MNKFESKYFNTAEVMDEALVELLSIKEYGFITIKELCEKAGVNRSTFYLHYENMEDLLAETLKAINKKFVTSFSETNLGKNNLEKLTQNEKMFVKAEYLYPLLTFMKENRKVLKLYKLIPNTFDTLATFDLIKKNCLDHVLSEFGIAQNIQKYYIEYYMSGLFAIIYAWIDGDCFEPIDDMIKIITRILNVEDFNQNPIK